MLKLGVDKYLIIITKVEAVGRIRGHTIYRIKATEFLPLQERALHVWDLLQLQDGMVVDCVCRIRMRTLTWRC